MRIFGDLTWQMPEKWPIWKKMDARKMGFSDRTFWGIWGGPSETPLDDDDAQLVDQYLGNNGDDHDGDTIQQVQSVVPQRVWTFL